METMDLTSHEKERGLASEVTWMDLEGILLSEFSQAEEG